MEKLDRWIARHQTASKVIVAIPWIVLEIWWLLLDVPAWIVAVFVFITLFAFFIHIHAAGDRLQKKPLEILKTQCDPYPFLEEMREQQSYAGADAVKQVRAINYAMALRNVGQYDQAYMLLSSINIDKNAGMLPMAKVVYYNNLMDLCFTMGKYQEAIIWYAKTAQIWNDMKPGKQKEQLRRVVEANRAADHFCRGEYQQTLGVLSQAKPENLCDRIENAMMYARTYLALGETEKARKPLQFVAENGNKLYFATEAKELLAKINMEETKL